MTFEEIYPIAAQYSLISQPRLWLLWDYAQKTRGIDGVMAEAGVYKGGSALVIGQADIDPLPVCLFDTFKGIPYDDVFPEGHKKGDFAESLENVSKVINQGTPRWYVFYEGDIELESKKVSGCKFRFVHIDLDIAPSTYYALNFFAERLVEGGYIILDDYDNPQTPGVKMSVTYFMEQAQGFSMEVINGQCVLWRIKA